MASTTYIGNTRSAPAWAKDFKNGREYLMPFGIKLDPAQFSNYGGVPVTLTAAAAANATSLTVAAINYGPTAYAATTFLSTGNVVIKSGTTLAFGTAGNKFAVTTADVFYGATTIPVLPIPTAMVVGDSANYSQYGGKFVPSGIFVGRTFAEQGANVAFGPADTATPDDEMYLVAFDVEDLTQSNNAAAYRPTSRVAVNYLPFTPSANDLVQLRKLYQCFVATD